MKCEIIAVGSELLTPFRQDTNSLYLTEKLNEIGVSVAFKTIVGDRKRDLVSAVRTALSRADIVAVMGGLGPTEDDLSREAVAEALGVGIRRDPQLVVALAARFAARRMTMTDNNLKQADTIEGAQAIPGSQKHPRVSTVPSCYGLLCLPPTRCRSRSWPAFPSPKRSGRWQV